MKVGLSTLGCRSNHFDTCALANRLKNIGFNIVPFSDQADFYIVNTCSVTQKAEFQSRQLARRARRRNPGAQIVLIGCYPQRDPDEVFCLTDADMIFGNLEKKNLDQLLVKRQEEEKNSRWVQVSPIDRTEEVINFGPWICEARSRIELKIQEGCNQSCSYCIVPQTRGKARSVSVDRVVAAINSIENQGFKEVVLTGTQLGAFGMDGGSRLSWELPAVLLASQDCRIRLSSLEPWHVGNKLLALYRDFENLCPHLHLSAQSFHNEVLKRMRRPITQEQLEEIIYTAIKMNSQMAIGLDVITGFPGEDERIFQHTYNVLSKLPVAYFHVFPFSPRPGTEAFSFKDRVRSGEIKKRVISLRELSQRKREMFYQKFVSKTLEVIVQNPSELIIERSCSDSRVFMGISANYLPVVFVSDSQKTITTGEKVRLKVEKVIRSKHPLLLGRIH